MQRHNTLKNRKFHKQAGLTLLELSIGLAIVLAIAALAIGIGTTTSTTQRASDAQTQVLQIAAAARAATVNGSYEGVNASILARTEKVPSAWVGPNGTTLSNPFGGQYILTPINLSNAGAPSATCSATTDPCNAVAITVDQLPPSACSSLITNASANFPVILSGGVSGTVLKNDRATPAVSLTPASVTTACEAGNATITYLSVG